MRSIFLSVPLLFAIAGCETPNSDAPHIREGWLAYVPESRLNELDQFRQRRSELNQQLAAAERDLDEIQSHVEMADRNVDMLEMRVNEAENQSDHAKKYGTHDEYRTAQDKLAEREAALRLGRVKHEYYDVITELARRRIDLLRERVDLADARYELAKARAISELDRPIAEEVALNEHRQEVMLQADAVERARVEALVARERVRLLAEMVGQRRDSVPEDLRTAQIEPMDSLFLSNAYEDEELRLEDGELRSVQGRASSEASMREAAKR